MKNSRIQHNDPSWGVFHDVVSWSLVIESLPTWEEILEIEYIRQRGEINMVLSDVQRWAFDRGLFHAVSWLQRCKENQIFWGHIYSNVIQKFEAEHGPRGGWVTPEMRKDLKRLEIQHKRADLEAQLRALED